MPTLKEERERVASTKCYFILATNSRGEILALLVYDNHNRERKISPSSL